MDAYLRANKALWDELTPIHAASYGLEEFKAGGSKLSPLERAEVGDVAGRSLLHLQCHFGLDTLSWARLGAGVTGADFSEEAIRLARSLSAELAIPAHFVCADLYDLPAALSGTFDIVFTSWGVLYWLPDLARWAEIVAHYLRPGGTFYIAEGHPLLNMFDNADDATGLRLAYPYFHRAEPTDWPPGGDYADPTARVAHPSYEWVHSLGDIVNALLAAGLRLEFLREHPVLTWRFFPFMERGADRLWRLPAAYPALPLSFSLKARKDEG